MERRWAENNLFRFRWRFRIHWSGYKKKRQAGVGILVRIHNDIDISTPDFSDPRMMAIDLKVNGFNIRVNGYATTHRIRRDWTTKTQLNKNSNLNKAIVKTQKKQKAIIVGDFNATTSISHKRCFFDGRTLLLTRLSYSWIFYKHFLQAPYDTSPLMVQ